MKVKSETKGWKKNEKTNNMVLALTTIGNETSTPILENLGNIWETQLLSK